MIRLDTNLLNTLGPSSSNRKDRSMEHESTQIKQSQSQLVSYKYTQSDEKSFTMFQQTVHHRLEVSLAAKFASPNRTTEEFAANQREERADLAANNILKFVELRLKHDVKDGATPEQLESRLAAALDGFEQGYEEANHILKDMNMLSEEVETDISLTKEKVLAGIQSLQAQYLGSEVNETANGAEPVTAKTQSEPLELDAVKQSVGQNFAQYSALQVGEARDFSFELQTRDGDRVTINASSLMAYQKETSAGTNRFVSESSLLEQQFAFTVDGELDEDELKAINDILATVNDLAQDFYAGDVSVAFEKALNMGFDSREISEFAFSMTRVTSVKAMQAYQPEQEILKPNVISELRPIGKFASELSRSLTVAKEFFSHPRELISSIVSQLDQSGDNQSETKLVSFSEFTQALLVKMDELEHANKLRNGGEAEGNL